MWFSADGDRPGRIGGHLPVVDNADSLLKLLYIRDSHGLRVPGMPTTERTPESGGSRLQSGTESGGRRRREEALARQWHTSLHWLLGTSGRHALTHEVLASGDASRLQEVMPAPWDESDQGLLDLEGFAAWFSSLPTSATVEVGHDDAAVRATSAAAERGLAVIVVLPIVDPPIGQIEDGGLLLSWQAYADAERRRAAMESFGVAG